MNSRLSNIKEFLHDKTKENLVVYEVSSLLSLEVIVFLQLELNSVEDPNEELRARAKSQGDCACRLWLIILVINLAVLAIVIFLILLLLIEIGPVRRLTVGHSTRRAILFA